MLPLEHYNLYLSISAYLETTALLPSTAEIQYYPDSLIETVVFY